MNAYQPSLLDLRPIVDVQHDPDESLDTRFRHWLNANPHVLDAFIQFALQAASTGRKRFGAKAIIERMRWEYAMQTTGDDFKLNNVFTSRLARAAVERHPELADLFEFRHLRS